MTRGLLILLAATDLAGGLLLVSWPGVAQELLHPHAIGTTFYPLQRIGAVWLARAALGIAAAIRPSRGRCHAVAAGWSLDVLADLLMVVRTAGAGPYAIPFHIAHAVIAAAATAWLMRAGRSSPAR